MLGCLKKFIESRWSSRSTVFAGYFAITAFILALKGVLSGGQYVAAITAIHAFIVVRAVSEDHNGKSDSDKQ